MSGGSCTRPGCTGSYDADGYCDECGHKAAAAAAAAAPATRGTGPSTRTGPTGRTTGATRASGRTRGTGRSGLGGGLLEMPRVPVADPTSAVLTNPVVPERKRTCGKCEEPVGQSRDGQPGATEGFCTNCGTPFSFEPKLKPGMLVDGRYEIVGCLAHGGLGWIYLARDKNVGDDVVDRWVVLKGLLNTGDADAMRAAVDEHHFLVSIDHPGIVKITDFVRPNPLAGTTAAYIVMEYVGGRTLKDIRADRSQGASTPLPLEQVLAYTLEVLPAFGYLHERGMVYCDYKPDNAIHSDDRLKLVDLGAVRHLDDTEGVYWGTVGYQAPEVGDVGPSVASDIYTVARTMAVLSLDFRGFSSTYADRLPDVADHPLLAEQQSYLRLLRTATHLDPAARFGSAAEMADQVLGVLRQVLAAADGEQRPAASAHFVDVGSAFGVESDAQFDGVAIAAALPVPRVDAEDPGTAFLAATRGIRLDELVQAAANAPADSAEVPIAIARAQLAAGHPGVARRTLDALDPLDWRGHWFRGLAALIEADPRAAVDAFDAVYDALPGEVAPQLALGVAAEWAGDRDAAAGHYRRVWTTDRGYVAAAFGLARVERAAGRNAASIAVLDQVPHSSSHHVAARIAAARTRIAGQPQAADLLDASNRLQELKLDQEREAHLTLELLGAALTWVRAGSPGPTARSNDGTPTGRVLGFAMNERGLRFGLERAYRTLAKVAPDRRRRIELVDRANQVRPRTLV